jgi:hypothetical protein
LNLRRKDFTFDQSFSIGFTEKHFASSFTLMPLSYPSKIDYRASLCSIALTFFASVIPLFAQKLKYCAVLLKIAIVQRPL